MRVLILASILLGLSGCADTDPSSMPRPREPSATDRGYYCGMSLAEHSGPRGQIFLEGHPEPLWFSSIQDALFYRFTEGETLRTQAFYVNDMGNTDWDRPQSGAWVEAGLALYVVDSRRGGGMGAREYVPFSRRETAEAFVRDYGGVIVSFEELPRSMIASSPPDPGI
ncbi:MAG: nitrous oxide reductase accessory protein NosL [Magnetococcales bacterium]|nr:nitrous oxide reductase accessory protein NosL [Magnetococcales bacterium]